MWQGADSQQTRGLDRNHNSSSRYNAHDAAAIAITGHAANMAVEGVQPELWQDARVLHIAHASALLLQHSSRCLPELLERDAAAQECMSTFLHGTGQEGDNRCQQPRSMQHSVCCILACWLARLSSELCLSYLLLITCTGSSALLVCLEAGEADTKESCQQLAG